MSARSWTAAASSARPPRRSPSQVRYLPARSRRASCDFPERGRSLNVRPEEAATEVGESPDGETSTGRGGPSGQVAGPPDGLEYPSSTTWALVPERPKAFTAESWGLSGWTGHAVISEVTRIGIRSQSKFGFGSLKCRCAGIRPRCIARTAFIMLAMPAAHSA